MKKQFLTAFAALSIAAIAISADRSYPVTVNNSRPASIYDTVPNTMDTTGNKWPDSSDRKTDTSMMRTDSSLHK